MIEFFNILCVLSLVLNCAVICFTKTNTYLKAIIALGTFTLTFVPFIAEHALFITGAVNKDVPFCVMYAITYFVLLIFNAIKLGLGYTVVWGIPLIAILYTNFIK